MKSVVVALITSILAGGLCKVHAQDETSTQLWTDYHAHYFKSEKREFYGDMGVRILLESNDWWQVYVRPSTRLHRAKGYYLYAGLGAFYTYDTDDPTLEIRPWQGFKVRWPVWEAIGFSHYFRLEERIVVNTNDWDPDFALRLRYKLSTSIPLKRSIYHFDMNPFYLPLSIEFFSDVGPTVDAFFASRLRIDAGLGYVRNNRWVFEFHFIVQKSHNNPDEAFDTDDFILRFQLKHLIEAKDYNLRQEDLPD